MSTNLLELIQSAFGDELVRQAAPFLGETEKDTGSALAKLLPAMLGGLVKQGSTVEGASRLVKALSGSDIDSGLLGNLAGLFSSGSRTESLVALGTELARNLFGDKVASLVSTVASLTGLGSSSVSKLLYLAAPLVFGYLKKLVADRGLDVAGLMGLLGDQKRSLSGLVDDRVAGALGLGSFFNEPAAAAPGTDYRAAVRSARQEDDGPSLWSRLWPWLALLAGLVAAATAFRGCQKEETTAALPESPAVSAPAQPKVAAEKPPVPAAALPAKLYFDVAAATLSPEGRKTVAEVSQAANSQGLMLAITGFTDRTGDSAKNIELAKQRALAVRDALISAGVPASRISMRPPLTITTTGSGSDAEARRVEISKAN